MKRLMETGWEKLTKTFGSLQKPGSGCSKITKSARPFFARIEMTALQARMKLGTPRVRIRRPAFLPWKQQALCFRRMVIVWDLNFNFTSCVTLCRCIMFEASRGSRALRIDSEEELICPRHAPRWWNAERYAQEFPAEDYSNDPYFDKFGGYAMFRYYAVSTGGPYSSLHLDHDRPIPKYEFEYMQQQAITLETEETLKAARAYEKEVYRHSKVWVERLTKAGRFDPKFLQRTREWQQKLEDKRPDIMELDSDEVCWKDTRRKWRFSITNDGGLEVEWEL